MTAVLRRMATLPKIVKWDEAVEKGPKSHRSRSPGMPSRAACRAKTVSIRSDDPA